MLTSAGADMVRPVIGSTLLKRLGVGPPVVAALVVTSTLFTVPAIRDAVTGGGVDYAILDRPLAYLIGAPLFGVWDTLSLLTASQHYAVLVTLIGLYVLARILAPESNRPPIARAGREVLKAALALVALFAFYALGLLLPRPMVGIEIVNQDLVTIDFHSHTQHSHDGWGLFSAARNRAWHERGGFDVAYVTDHYTWRGFDDAEPDNPERVGERTTLLIGAEIRIRGRPTNILGARERYVFALDEDSVHMEPDSLAAAYERGGPPPSLLYTMPGALERVVPFNEHDRSGVIAIELNDGSPRGLEQVKSEREEILALADSFDLAVVAASNLHGWGRTVAAWSVMEIPGWQEMSPTRIGEVIESRLHAERRQAVGVIERRIPYHDGSSVKIAFTFPWLVWEHFRMLSIGERLSWLLWIGVVVLVRGRSRISKA